MKNIDKDQKYCRSRKPLKYLRKENLDSMGLW